MWSLIENDHRKRRSSQLKFALQVMGKDNYNSVEDFLNDPSFQNWIKGLSTDDTTFWEAYLNRNPQKQDLMNEAAKLITGLNFRKPRLPNEQVEAALSKLNKQLDQKEDRKLQKDKRSLLQRRSLFVAASILVLIGCFFLLQQYVFRQEVVYRTAFGQQVDLKLEDGTVVVLNANSILRFYSNNSREVWLNGEAFFEVEKKPSKAKFNVHTNDMVVEVLGTTFNVNTRKEKTEVLLEEGKVKLNLKNGTNKLMAPGDLVSYSAKMNQVLESKQAVRSELYTSWKDGSLIFEQITLQQAMEEIGATYGVQVIFQNQDIANRNITLAVPTKNLDICIMAFQKALNIEIEKVNKQQLIIR